jgi:hypothetical protein
MANDAAIFQALSDKWNDEISYLRRPVEWCADKPGHLLHDMQKRVAESVRDNRFTAVPSGHELGKSLCAADLIAWWIDSHPVGQAMVISTAPSFHQVAAILWREIGRTHKAAKLDGKINRSPTPNWILGDEAVGFGRKPADHEESAFQGMHNRYVLVVIDEAGGVDKRLYDAIRSIVANENSRVLAIGNPDDPGSYFQEVCEPGSGWNTIRLDVLRSPNFSRLQIEGTGSTPKYPLVKALMEAEGIAYSTEKVSVELSEHLSGPLYVEEALTAWCGVPADACDTMEPDELRSLLLSRTADSPLFTSKVRGLFPTATATGVIPLGWVQRAVDRWQDWQDKGGRPEDVPNPTRRVVGVDVAYGGMDETVVAVRFGDAISNLYRYRNADTRETAKEAAIHLHETGTVAVVDVIGIGAGVFDTLRAWRKSGKHVADVVPFNAAASTSRKDKIGQFKFKNDRAAAWWRMRELLDPARGSKIMLPNDQRLIQELVAVKYKYLAGGVIQIESKDDIKKRLGRSTDSADSVIQAFWVDGLEYRELPPVKGRTGYEYNSGKDREYAYAGTDGGFTQDDVVAARPGMSRSPVRAPLRPHNPYADDEAGW